MPKNQLSPEMEAAMKRGEEAARSLLAKGGIVLLQDEAWLEGERLAETIGWNSVAVSDEARSNLASK